MRLYATAASSLRDENHARAAQCYQEVVREDPNDSFAWLMLAEWHEREGRLAEALGAAQRAVELQPAEFYGLRTAARICCALGEHDRARDYVTTALENPPGQPFGLVARAFFQATRWALYWARRLPFFRRPLDGKALRSFDPVQQSKDDYQEWEKWARKYLHWLSSQTAGGDHGLVH